jgi:hypothetical protein
MGFVHCDCPTRRLFVQPASGPLGAPCPAHVGADHLSGDLRRRRSSVPRARSLGQALAHCAAASVLRTISERPGPVRQTSGLPSAEQCAGPLAACSHPGVKAQGDREPWDPAAHLHKNQKGNEYIALSNDRYTVLTRYSNQVHRRDTAQQTGG